MLTVFSQWKKYSWLDAIAIRLEKGFVLAGASMLLATAVEKGFRCESQPDVHVSVHGGGIAYRA